MIVPRRLLAFTLAAATVACGRSSPPERFEQKLVILGFDGLDPKLTGRWIREGRLPNLAALASRGGLHTLETSHSPESPAAWASFATGTNAGKHNIYDFLVRDTQTYLANPAMVRREPPRFLFNYFPLAPSMIASTRGGTSFWVTAGRAGVRSSILTVPVTFPPETVPNGELLAGLPLPDIRDTTGTFSFFATDLGRDEEGHTDFGGVLRRLAFEGNVATAEIIGPPNPIVREQERELRAKATLTDDDRERLTELSSEADLRLPFSITWNREARTANLAIAGETIHLAERRWSKWIPLDFRVNALVQVHGMAQALLIGAGRDLQLYISPVNWHPANPPAAMSSPPGFSADLYERLGLYRTLGWAEATWPLTDERIDEAAFLDDADAAFNDRAATILSRIDARRWDLLVGVVETTDRVQHMMWRFIDPEHPLYDEGLAGRFGGSILGIYQKADTLVGQVMSRLPPKATVMVVSDHGFHSFRYSVDLNSWLAQRGFMALKGRPSGGRTHDAFFGGGTVWNNVDWPRTRAYSMGLGQVYVNLRGREAQSTVGAGAEYDSIVDALVSGLRELRDPRTGRAIVRNVYKRADIYSGPYLEEAADLQVGFDEGYRTSWQTSFGGTPPRLIEPNLSKWSGDHGSFDYQITPGVLISSTPLTVAEARIIDIAPTVLRFFGLPVAKEIDGRPLF